MNQLFFFFGENDKMYQKHYRKAIYIPGGHGVHPNIPLVEELENVPTGQGKRDNSTSERLLTNTSNPEAIKASTNAATFGSPFLKSILMAAAAVSIGFLGSRV